MKIKNIKGARKREERHWRSKFEAKMLFSPTFMYMYIQETLGVSYELTKGTEVLDSSGVGNSTCSTKIFFQHTCR